MKTTIKTTKLLAISSLPAAVCRELAAHLEQIEGVTAQLIPLTTPEFDYSQSQIGELLLEYPASLESQSVSRIEEICNYYAQIHSESLSVLNPSG